MEYVKIFDLVDKICNGNDVDVSVRDKLQEYMKKYGIDIDLISLINNKNKDLILDELSNYISLLHEKLSQTEKQKFLEQLSFQNHRMKYKKLNWKSLGNRTKIFEKINFDKKYEYVDLGILFTLFINDDEKKMEILIELAKEGKLNEIDTYLKEMEVNGFKKIDLPVEKVLEIIKRIERIEEEKSIKDSSNLMEKNLDEDTTCIPTDFRYRMINSISKNRLIEYYSFKGSEAFEGINTFNIQEIYLLLGVFQDDERYQAMLFASINNEVSYEEIAMLCSQIKDDYILANKMYLNTLPFEQDFNLTEINEYFDLKEKILNLSGTQQMHIIDELIKLDDEKYFKRISLLKYIKDKNIRKKVIETIKLDERGEISQYEVLANAMITEFFQDNCHLNEYEKEKLQVILNSYNCNIGYFQEEFGRICVGKKRGKCENLSKSIYLTPKLKDDKKNFLFALLHEKAHSISMDNDFKSCDNFCIKIEEGMANTFADLVLRYYLSKHNKIVVDGEMIDSARILGIEEDSYIDETSFVRTMLYPLEVENTDMDAIKEYYLGEKSRFLDMCFEEGYSEKFKKNYLGMPVNVEVNENDLYQIKKGCYTVINKNSAYVQGNSLIFNLHNMDRASEENKGIRSLVEEAIDGVPDFSYIKEVEEAKIHQQNETIKQITSKQTEKNIGE